LIVAPRSKRGILAPITAVSGYLSVTRTPVALPPHENREHLVQQRRRFKQPLPLEERLAAEAKRLRDEANHLPPGVQRESLLRKARQADTASHMSDWLTSPGLQPPR